ncbi:MAG TPA: helix-turn-helix transcriptional regulator, partial [Myxococcaceae bacterium]|nr:helix-turn-helix transcriptional regulator [Myxococcaceae bacterium]
AAETHRARAPFSTRFRHKVGVPPRTFLDQVRMHRAKKLLLASRLPLAEIARSVGFGSHRAFRRAFVRATGITPTAYRGAERARRVTGPRAPSPPGPRAEPTDR